MAEPCGCYDERWDEGDGYWAENGIQFCDMHKAAPEMLAALTRIATAGTIGDNEMGEWMREQARKASAQARGQEAK